MSESKTPFATECIVEDASDRFAGHFPGQVIIPGAALVDLVVCEIENATGKTVTAVNHVKFAAAAVPQRALSLHGSFSGTRAHFELRNQAQLIGSGTLALGPRT